MSFVMTLVDAPVVAGESSNVWGILALACWANNYEYGESEEDIERNRKEWKSK